RPSIFACTCPPVSASVFLFLCYGYRRDLHSFPTRRSSDLAVADRVVVRLRQPGGRVPDHRAPDPVLLRAVLGRRGDPRPAVLRGDRKSTRLNSSHVEISYAVFCLKKKNKSYEEHDDRSCYT